MAIILVHNTIVLVQPMSPPHTLMAPISTVPGGKQTSMKANGYAGLIKEDFDTWVKTYTSPYITPGYPIPGVLKGQSATIDKLSKNTTGEGKPVVLINSIITIELQPSPPAMLITPAGPQMDSNSRYQATLKIISPGQFIAKSK